MDTAIGFSRPAVTLTQKVYEQILELVIRSAGEEELRLNEKRLMEIFGVSKAPVREALVRLCSEGVLKSVPRYGYVVVPVTEKDNRDTIELRVSLELQALKETSRTLNPEQLEALNRQIAQAKARRDVDVWELWEDNEEFHLMLASFAGNRILLRFLKECMSLRKRQYARYVYETSRSLRVSIESEAHGKIVAALAQAQFEKAAELLEADIRSGSK